MKFNEVKKIVNNPRYWDFLNLEKNQRHLTTDFKIQEIGISTRYCEEDDDFFLGEFVIIYDNLSKCASSQGVLALYDLCYKEIQYCNTLYISYYFDGDTFTKPIRMKKNEDIHCPNIQKKIKIAITEYLELVMMDRAIENFRTDNIKYMNIERRRNAMKRELEK